MNRTDITKFHAKVQELNDCLAADVHASPVPIKVQAAEADIKASRLYAIADRNNPELPSLACLFRLLPAFATTHTLDYLASQQGHVTVPLPSPATSDLPGLAEMLDAFAAVVKHHASAIADGTLCEMDAAIYRERGTRLVKAVLGQMQHVDAEARRSAVSRKVTA